MLLQAAWFSTHRLHKTPVVVTDFPERQTTSYFQNSRPRTARQEFYALH